MPSVTENDVPKAETMPSGYTKVNTLMQDVDMLVALPQWYVNFNLSQLLATGVTEAGKSLKKLELAFTGSNDVWLRGTISALRVVVHDPERAAVVRLVLHFESGAMDYYELTHGTPVKRSCDIAGLQFGFAANLNLVDLSNDRMLPPAVKARIATLLSNLGQGSFTVQQLLMDLQAAAIDQYDRALTVFPALMGPSAQAAFVQYLTTYLADLSAVGGNVLGYTIKVSNPGNRPDPVATFPPTRIDIRTNQYLGPANGTTTRLCADLDTINFLMMTGGAALPGGLQRHGGNFVVPEDERAGRYGTIAIRKALFVDQFLLPQLGPLVTSYLKLSDTRLSLNAVSEQKIGALIADELGGHWSSGVQSSHSHKTNDVSNDDIYYNCLVDTKLRVIPDTNRIEIQRDTYFDIENVHWYGVEGHALKKRCKTWYHVPLKITVDLLGVSDGRLTVDVKTETPKMPPNEVSDTPYWWLSTRGEGDYGAMFHSADQAGVIGHFTDCAVPEAIQPNVKNAIMEHLNFSPFVFPGGKQFFMKDLLFNDEGDLLAGVQYK